MLVFATPGEPEESSEGAEGRPPGGNVLERLARQVEPSLAGQIDRVPLYVDFYRRELANDTRLFAFDVTADTSADRRVTLTGFVEFPETRESIEAFLRIFGFEVKNELETLPAASLGERTLGFVKSTHSLSFDRPRARRGVVTDCLLGEPLFLLREDGDQVLVHSGEGYLGYISSRDIHRVDEASFARYLDGPNVRVTSDYTTADGLLIPTGARLKWIGTEGQLVTAELPTGETVSLPASGCEVRQPPTTQIDAILKAAKSFEGTRYFWGGRTTAGIDCSGLAQVAYAAVGWHLPRDSNQQFLMGRLTGTRGHRGAMRAGDTLYFIAPDGKIRHTAIYLGEDRYVNAEVPKVKTGSLNPAHHDYDPDRDSSFVFAKRLVE
jgi:cell wall-associated NlpC family hydrolase